MPDAPLKVLWHWLTMGPYHFARMNALAQRPEIELKVIETTRQDDHGWVRGVAKNQFSLTTFSSECLSSAVCARTRQLFRETLFDHAPDVVIASGYADMHSLLAVAEYPMRHRSASVLLWSESTIFDARRSRILEAFKGSLVRQFDGALVAGSAHASYLQSLGMPSGRIEKVGNCVDNKFFAQRAASAALRSAPCGSRSTRYFLYVGRFLPQKNLPALLSAFRLYRKQHRDQSWDLMLVGAGPQEQDLRRQVDAEGISGVRFAGLHQAEEVAADYSGAGCLVLPSISEPWGLVVNEAMASGLPVLVSNRCGCAPDLVHEGENGFVFDPFKPQQLASLMLRIACGQVDSRALGERGRKIIAAYTPELFAERAESHIRNVHRLKASHRQQHPLPGVAMALVKAVALLDGVRGPRAQRGSATADRAGTPA